MLNFDHLTHTYDVDGDVYSSVTTVLKNMGFIDDKWFTAEARDRGSAVHEMTYGIDVGDFALDDFADSPHFGYVQGWDKFKKDFDIEILEAEKIVWSITWRIAGTLDRIVKMNGKQALIDLKTGGHSFANGLQLAAYDDIGGVNAEDRMIVHLHDNGTYTLGVADKKIGPFNSKSWDTMWGVIRAADYYRREYGKS